MTKFWMQLEYLSDQYDREYEEFYLQGRDQVVMKYEAIQHCQQEHKEVPD